MVLLSAHLCASHPEAPLSQEALTLAAAVEMLHTATLIHDDLIDDANVRRGVVTLNTNWTPAAVVLVGDLAFAWAARLAARAQRADLMQRFSETLEVICAGELQQMFNGNTPSVDSYYERIFAKTASLFALSAEVGPRLAGRPEEEAASMRRFGRLVGLAFQIVDDVLDLTGDEATLGKPAGEDVRHGLITLPFHSYAASHPDDPRVPLLLKGQADEALLESLVADVRASEAPRRALAVASEHVQEAVSLLRPYPLGPYREALEEIATFAVSRQR
jgi:geranylgeranyl pyrophosphate synthase